MVLLALVLFKVIGREAACLKYDLVKMKRQSSDLDACWKNAKRMWMITSTKRLKYLAKNKIGKGGKGKIMVESSISIPCARISLPERSAV